MAQAWVRKEFPEMRQNEKEIKFIKVRDAVRTVGQFKGELMLSRGPESTFVLRVQGVESLSLWVIC